MYHPAAALRTPAIERDSYADMATIPAVLLDARARRSEPVAGAAPLLAVPAPPPFATPIIDPSPAIIVSAPEPADTIDTDQLTLF